MHDLNRRADKRGATPATASRIFERLCPELLASTVPIPYRW